MGFRLRKLKSDVFYLFFKQKVFKEFIRKKEKIASSGCALSSIEESLKEVIKFIGHEVDMESLT